MKLEIIGVNGGATAEFDPEVDTCFGKAFDKNSPTCKQCNAPFLVDGRIMLCRDVCAQWKRTRRPGDIYRMGADEVERRLIAGESLASLFGDILADADPDVFYRQARQLLYNRLQYVQRRGVPAAEQPIPNRQELMKHVHDQQGDTD